MRLRLRRVVFVSQWFAPVVSVAVVVFGRQILVGDLRPPTSPGEALLVALSTVVGVVVVVLPAFVLVGWPLYLPPVLTVVDRVSRRERRVSGAYAVAAIVQWVAVIPGALAVPALWRHSGLQTLTVIPMFGRSRALPPVVEAIGTTGLIVAGIAYAATVAIALHGVVASSRAGSVAPRASRIGSPE